jgi:hypothetical protein
MSTKFRFVAVTVAALFITARPVTVTAATLTFDSITASCTTAVPAGYGGLTWSSTFNIECNGDYASTYGNSYGSVSGDYAAFNGLGAGESHISLGSGTFSLLNAWFTSFADHNQFSASGFSAFSLAVVGYRPGDTIDAPTYQMSFDLSSTQYVLQTFGWTGLNDLVLFTGNGAVSDSATVYAVDGLSWLMDDANITIGPSNPVPEPGTLVLVGLGIVGAARRRMFRRSQRHVDDR